MENKIETIVRFYVKKTLTEVIRDLNKLIESKIDKKVNERLDLMNMISEDKKYSLREVYSQPEVSVDEVKAPVKRKKLTAESLGITEDVWRSVYSDIEGSGNPILNETKNSDEDFGSSDKPEYVSEDTLQEMGLFKDYSKHLEILEKKDNQKRGDVDLEAKRKEILQKTIR